MKAPWRTKEYKSEGPWTNEPDREVFEYKGVTCLIDRKFHGALCGYVGIPLSNKYANLHIYDDKNDLDVHGDITWSENRLPNDIQNELLFKHMDLWWLGFDCSHINDHVPAFEESNNELMESFSAINKLVATLKEESIINKKTYRDIEFVRNQIKHLVDQIG